MDLPQLLGDWYVMYLLHAMQPDTDLSLRICKLYSLAKPVFVCASATVASICQLSFRLLPSGLPKYINLIAVSNVLLNQYMNVDERLENRARSERSGGWGAA